MYVYFRGRQYFSIKVAQGLHCFEKSLLRAVVFKDKCSNDYTEIILIQK